MEYWCYQRNWQKEVSCENDTPLVVVWCLSPVCLFVTPWTVARQAPLSMGFPRQGYRSGLSFPSPGDLPDPGVEPVSPALQADSLPLSHQGSPIFQSASKSQNSVAFHLTKTGQMKTSLPFSVFLYIEVIVDLQRCVGFWCMAKQFAYMCVYKHSSTYSFPL